mmetsp:Transcript_7139/g.18486  ORF Transcript_7139/g.18486 Transcript_7139/m.18486 type:complete len:512 (-) Transcript_7139:2172-3707(-)
MKLIDKLRGHKGNGNGEFLFGLEFFPPHSDAAVDNLVSRVQRMGEELEPGYIDISARMGGGRGRAMESLVIGSIFQSNASMETQIRLTCLMSRDDVKRALASARRTGIQNVFCVKGEMFDASAGAGEHLFSASADLVKLVRELHGDYFNVAVAGHPGRDTTEDEYEAQMQSLLRKVEAGADTIISQFFFSWSAFEKWERDCKDRGICVPIIPGILPIVSYSSFKAIEEGARLKIPPLVKDRIEAAKEDDEKIKDIGVDIAEDIAKQALQHGHNALHFFTMNLERSTTSVLERLGVSRKGGKKNVSFRTHDVKEEFVRPIFWVFRPDSYLARTAGWDEFPNGRWGDMASPAFGDLTSSLCNIRMPSLKVRQEMWRIDKDTDAVEYSGGIPPRRVLEQRVQDTFIAFLKGEGNVKALPWCSTPVGGETGVIENQLCALISAGLYSINSQPAVNGLSSTHSTFGWGGGKGRVYQKAYVEFFIAAERVEDMRKELEKEETWQYHIVDEKVLSKSA